MLELKAGRDTTLCEHLCSEISKIYKYHYADTTQEQQGSPPQQQLKQTDAD